MKIFKRKVIFMRNIDPKSLCIGFLGAALIFTITGAKQKKNLGDIVVNSITVLDEVFETKKNNTYSFHQFVIKTKKRNN